MKRRDVVAMGTAIAVAGMATGTTATLNKAAAQTTPGTATTATLRRRGTSAPVANASNFPCRAAMAAPTRPTISVRWLAKVDWPSMPVPN